MNLPFKYHLKNGHPLPLGITKNSEGINFSIVSKEAKEASLLINYDNKVYEVAFDPILNKTGDIWHLYLETDAKENFTYNYKFKGFTSDTDKELLDPYAKIVNSPSTWGYSHDYKPWGVVLSENSAFAWENDQSPDIDLKDLIIYEMHVRSFTQDSTSHVAHPGTFKGIIDKIPYLVELGVNAIELLPIQEFNENEYKPKDEKIDGPLHQYWGYSTVNFFCPMNRFAASEKLGASINEFKLLVKALHKNGIKVILDVVFNHTNEGDITGPVTSFKGIDPKIYYMLDAEGKLLDFTGCGNTFNCNHPVTQKLIIDALRYWVLEMHVDGFRFDLASIFLRDTYGNPQPTTPIIEAISKDPILSNKILIAEPWDAVGLYQVGHFYKNNRWSEWNGRYRDTIRRFIKGTLNNKGKFATSLSGSQDLYGNKGPSTSINFITAHDGFSLCDLVSYNYKHNLANGEYNRDGQNENDSWNCGIEGETNDISILTLRERQMKNFHLTLLLSQGIPMLNMGDEYGHTKRGNNNTWCQDNELNWFLWNKISENGSFHRFYKQMIFFRKEYPSLRLGRFLTEEDIKWYGSNGQTTAWDQESQFLAFILKDSTAKKRIYCAWNAQNTSLHVELPSGSPKWSLVAYTANAAPDDFYEKEHRPLLENTFFEMAPYSALILISDL